MQWLEEDFRYRGLEILAFRGCGGIGARGNGVSSQEEEVWREMILAGKWHAKSETEATFPLLFLGNNFRLFWFIEELLWKNQSVSTTANSLQTEAIRKRSSPTSHSLLGRVYPGSVFRTPPISMQVIDHV